MFKNFESRIIKDPFLIKEIVEFNYDKMYEISNKKIILKPNIKLGTPYKNYQSIIDLFDYSCDYLLIDGFIIKSKRGVKNKVYILTYDELLVWLLEVNNFFEGPINITPIKKSNPNTYKNASNIFHMIEEGVMFLF